MPIAHLHLIEGYSDDDKTRLGKAVTAAIMSVVPATADAVSVLIAEHKATEYMRSGEHRSPAPALPDPATIVTAYLSAMEDRDLEKAGNYLADEFEMHFPNAAPMRDLGELITWATHRYDHVRKTYSAIESFQGDDCAVVIVRGHLDGAWPDGSSFQRVRFIDRFEVVQGKIRFQEVWNDLGEVRKRA